MIIMYTSIQTGYTTCAQYSVSSSLYTRRKNFLWKWTASRDGPVKSTETRQGWKHKKTTMLQKKIMVKKDWKITLHLLQGQATKV